LGYGGGFYDRTLAKLRRNGAALAIGLAYAGQEMAHVPHDDKDQPLDWIVTEDETIRVNRG
jgi:5-formyltetrahydrofolate cyclo-ligase